MLISLAIDSTLAKALEMISLSKICFDCSFKFYWALREARGLKTAYMNSDFLGEDSVLFLMA